MLLEYKLMTTYNKICFSFHGVGGNGAENCCHYIITKQINEKSGFLFCEFRYIKIK